MGTAKAQALLLLAALTSASLASAQGGEPEPTPDLPAASAGEPSPEASSDTPEPDTPEPETPEPEQVSGESTGESTTTSEPGAATPAAPTAIRYILERIDVRGQTRTDPGVIRNYLPLRPGQVLDVDDPAIEGSRWRLLGTGWFEEVRLALERGSERGRVVLVVHVRERNTLIIQSLALGVSEGFNGGMSTEPVPYFGLSLADLNLFGTGIGAEVSTLLSIPQQGVRLRMGQSDLMGSGWGLSGMAFFNNGREFFGNDDVVVSVASCTPGDPPCGLERNAVVEYRRFGGSLGTSVDLGSSFRFALDWQLEGVDVVSRPPAASHRRGTAIEPIDFHVFDGLSWVSLVTLTLSNDERDDPGVPSRGRYVFVRGDLSGTVIGSSYDFARVQAGWREWIPLPGWRHSLRLGAFVGAAVGDTPFFYRFYLSDLSDLIPARVLELNLDRRAPPNLLSTSIAEMRAQELAARIDIEYSIRIIEGDEAFRGLHAYGLIGLYGLMDRRDLEVAIPGYDGFARVPIDLTFDFGVRFDTAVGVFQLGFSTLLGFVQL